MLMANAHLNRYQAGDNISMTRGKKFRDVIAPTLRNWRDGVPNQRYVVSG